MRSLAPASVFFMLQRGSLACLFLLEGGSSASSSLLVGISVATITQGVGAHHMVTVVGAFCLGTPGKRLASPIGSEQ